MTGCVDGEPTPTGWTITREKQDPAYPLDDGDFAVVYPFAVAALDEFANGKRSVPGGLHDLDALNKTLNACVDAAMTELERIRGDQPEFYFTATSFRKRIYEAIRKHTERHVRRQDRKVLGSPALTSRERAGRIAQLLRDRVLRIAQQAPLCLQFRPIKVLVLVESVVPVNVVAAHPDRIHVLHTWYHQVGRHQIGIATLRNHETEIRRSTDRALPWAPPADRFIADAVPIPDRTDAWTVQYIEPTMDGPTLERGLVWRDRGCVWLVSNRHLQDRWLAEAEL